MTAIYLNQHSTN